MQKQTIAPQYLNLNLDSSFHVQGAHDTSLRCGPHGTPRTIKYHVAIRSTPEMVDSKGFIIDWREISLAVAKKYKSVNEFPSCERFAIEICEQVHDMLEGRCVSIDVQVSIEGLPANMSAQWEQAA